MSEFEVGDKVRAKPSIDGYANPYVPYYLVSDVSTYNDGKEVIRLTTSEVKATGTQFYSEHFELITGRLQDNEFIKVIRESNRMIEI